MNLAMHSVGVGLAVFALRLCDVPISTVRTIFTIRGYRLVSFCLGIIESAIWIFAISRVMKYLNDPWAMIGWSLGFASGTVLGISIEKWIGSGTVLVRCISRSHAIRLKEHLHSEGFGVTVVQGIGFEGTVLVLFIVAPRKRENEVLSEIRQIDPEAFITIEPVSRAIGGFPVTAVPPQTMKK